MNYVQVLAVAQCKEAVGQQVDTVSSHHATDGGPRRQGCAAAFAQVIGGECFLPSFLGRILILLQFLME